MESRKTIFAKYGRLFLLAWLTEWVGVASAQAQLRIEVISAYNLVVDSNVESPSTYAPRSAYLGSSFGSQLAWQGDL